MDKEVLTTRSVQRFLRKLSARAALVAVVVAPVFGVMLALVVAFGPAWPLLFLLILSGVIMAVMLMEFVCAFIMSFHTPIMVKAKRIKPVGKTDVFNLVGGRMTYALFFDGYGRILLRQHMYEDFEMGTLMDRELWESTFSGDDFYLLLDPFRRIVYPFPCNNFEYAGVLTPSRMEK